MVVKLKDVADIQMGYSFRSRLESSTNGTVSVIQMKDLTDDNLVDSSNLIKIDDEGFKTHHFVKSYDLVFRSRGQRTSTAIILEDLNNAILAAPLFRIRIKNPETINPLYLNWYISQSLAQIFLQSRLEGTHGGMISHKTIGQLKVYVPSFDKQILIVEIQSLMKREADILNELADKKSTLVTEKLMKIVKGE